MTDVVTLSCPYCGAPTDVHVEADAGHCIEDCMVCCRAIELIVRSDDAGALQVQALRGDE
ncbi:MAG: CPXCG motif-containing cysteine-rich protein [Proteobacteria bacterium]|nr:CPXCG motif-containing cysteine-rich protein [Pseudomonadota bacterium]